MIFFGGGGVEEEGLLLKLLGMLFIFGILFILFMLFFICDECICGLFWLDFLLLKEVKMFLVLLFLLFMFEKKVL